MKERLEMRLDKFLAQSSVGTRKVVRTYVKEGNVKVNGNIVLEPAVDIDEEKDVITYLEQVIKYKGKVYYMFNKPMGCITARKDESSKTVFEYFNDADMNGVSHVGRLDKDTEGLLLFTNDGDFNNALMNPDKHVNKTYYFIALGSIDENKKKLLEEGISIGEEEITKPAKLEIIREGLYNELKDELELEKFHFVNSNFYEQYVTAGKLTISEGRKHQVKRMLKAVGCYIIYLNRLAIGDLILDENLQKGKYRSLTEEEVMMFI